MKSQASIEFMILASILLLFFILQAGTSSYFHREINDIQVYNEAKKISDNIAFEIDMAFKSGDGYEKRFYIQENFLGIYNYDIIIDNYTVSIKWNSGGMNRTINSQIIMKNITGDVVKGSNFIKNNQSVIYVN